MGDMTHQDIDRQEIVEGYVRNRLTAEQRLAFEEHFFACDECFDKVQMTERFVQGVQYAAEDGLLATEVPGAGAAKPTSFWTPWLRPSLALSAAVAVALAAVLAWLLLYRTPQLKAELSRERDGRERALLEEQQKLDRATEELQGEISRRTDLERQLAELQANNRPGLAQPEANPPVVLLEAERSREAPIAVVVPAGARSLVLLNDPGPGARSGSYRLEISSTSNRHLMTVEGLKKNADGALSASLPVSTLNNGIYLVRLYAIDRGRAELAGEYRISIRKK